jgi:hypothetical protein
LALRTISNTSAQFQLGEMGKDFFLNFPFWVISPGL